MAELDRDDPPLRADCARCFALCCVVPALSASADFAIDKPAGQPCRNLRADFRCGIHDQLRPRGFPGCTAYDCFGAGQRVAQATFGGQDWRRAPDTAAAMFAAFTVMRHLHELLWYLAQAMDLPAARPLRADLSLARDGILHVAAGDAQAIQRVDVAAHRQDIDPLLRRASELNRARARADATAIIGRRAPARGPVDRRMVDLIGARLRGADLRGTDLRGAFLIRADLRGADLRFSDLIGADLRGADLRGADLRDTLFLTQSQVGAADGDAATLLPRSVRRPAHWDGRAQPRERTRRDSR